MEKFSEAGVENWEFSEEEGAFLDHESVLEAFEIRDSSGEDIMDTDSTPLLVTNSQSVNSRRVTAPENRKTEDGANDQPQRMTPFVYTLTFMSAIGGFLFGYDTGIVSGAMILLKEPFSLNSLWQELVVSITIGFAAVAAFAGGFLNNALGRKPVIMIASFIFTGGALILGCAANRTMLLIGRATLGVGIGFASMTVPMYIAECAPNHLRGRMVTLNNVFITFGQVVAAVVAGIFSYNKDGWRYMLGLAGIPSLIQFVGFFFMPESPRWLIGKGKDEQATEILKKIRGTDEVMGEIQSIKQSCEEDERALVESGASKYILLEVLQTAHLRRALFVGCMLQCFQQISGINTVMYYSATIIKFSGVEDESLAIWLASLTAAVNFLFTLVGLYLVERIGRRTLTLGSLVGTTVSLAILAAGFQLSAHNSPPVTVTAPANTTQEQVCANYTFCNPCMVDTNCGFCYEDDDDASSGAANGSCLAVALNTQGEPDQGSSRNGRCVDPDAAHVTWAYDNCPTSTAWMATFGLVLYLVCFAPGMGPMPWTINSEIYPLWARSTGNSLATTTNWVFNLLVSMTFLTLTEVLTRYGAFWLYTGLAFIGCLFVYFFLPETKGKKLEEVETLFQKPWCT